MEKEVTKIGAHVFFPEGTVAAQTNDIVLNTAAFSHAIRED